MSLLCFIGKKMETISGRYLITLALLLTAPCRASDTQQVRQFAEQFVLDQMTVDPTSRVEVSSGPIDDRLGIHACSGHLTARLAGSEEVRRTNSVYLKCEAEPIWDLYLPVRVKVLRPFVSVADAAPRGTVLDEGLMTIEFMDEILLRGDTFSDTAPLVGSRLKRDLRAGQPVRQNQICVVCRGDKVEIQALTGGMQIKTQGTALQDGSFGEAIRVENNRSKRVIQAVVAHAGKVRVDL